MGADVAGRESALHFELEVFGSDASSGGASRRGAVSWPKPLGARAGVPVNRIPHVAAAFPESGEGQTCHRASDPRRSPE